MLDGDKPVELRARDHFSKLIFDFLREYELVGAGDRVQ